MSDKPRYIGINQRVPIRILDHFIATYLATGEVDRTLLKLEMAGVYKGKNRSSKAAMYARKILTYNTVSLQFIRDTISVERYNNLSAPDKAALIFSLIAEAYPIFHDVIEIMAKVYRVQKVVSRKYVFQKISSLYGSNRTLVNALDAIFPMLFDIGFLIREKPGVYRAVAGLELQDEKICELYVACGIRLSGGKHISLEDFEYRDWHYFLKPKLPPYKNQKIIAVTLTGPRNGYVQCKKYG